MRWIKIVKIIRWIKIIKIIKWVKSPVKKESFMW